MLFDRRDDRMLPLPSKPHKFTLIRMQWQFCVATHKLCLEGTGVYWRKPEHPEGL